MAKKSAQKRLERLESICIGAGFLLRQLQARYGADFSIGMDQQVRNCIRDCSQAEHNHRQRADRSTTAATQENQHG